MSNDIYKQYVEETEKCEYLKKKYDEANEYITSLENKLDSCQNKLDDMDNIIKNTVQKAVDIACKKVTDLYEVELAKRDLIILQLKKIINNDANTTGIPTSQTPINKEKRISNINSREKTGMNKGGQYGHAKSKLEKFSDDEVTDTIEHTVDSCSECDSTDLELIGFREKDELDIKITVKKYRHKFYEYKCRKCKKITKSPIPLDLKEENQYGKEAQTIALSLMNEGLVSFNRSRKFICGMTDGQVNPSEGYLAKLQKRASNSLAQFIIELKRAILSQKLLHWDDTVIMINKSRGCLRFYGTDNLALYAAHLTKGKEGLTKDGILQNLSADTIVEHDHAIINYNTDYIFKNAECCAHLGRDTKKISIYTGHKWANDMLTLLTETNKKRDDLITNCIENFSEEFVSEFNEKYDRYIVEGFEECEKNKQTAVYTDEVNLLERYRDFKANNILWVTNFEVPYSNNLSERSLRMSKIKMKVSGQFENEITASYYANINSYIETCYRNGINKYYALRRLVNGDPLKFEEIFKAKEK